MKYFVSYTEIFLNDDVTKREGIRLLCYNHLITFLTRKQIEGNYIVEELNRLKEYFESKDFCQVYFLSPYIINEIVLVKEIVDLIVKSGESNTFNNLLNTIQREINFIKINSKLETLDYIEVNTADKYLDVYLKNPADNIYIDLPDENEKQILIENIKQGVKNQNFYLTLLKYKMEFEKVSSKEEYKKLLWDSIYFFESNKNKSDSLILYGRIILSEFNDDKDKYTKAFNIYLQGSKLNSLRSAYLVGFCYFRGLGVNKDIETAKKYWEKGNKFNYSDSITGLGVYYLTLNNKDKAKEYFNKAAKLGDYKAMLLLDTEFDRN